MSPEKNDWIVLKFGGTSVASAENWKKIYETVSGYLESGSRICIVHSALAGVSNALQEVIDKAGTESGEETADFIKEKHLELAAELDIDGESILESEFEELEHLVKGIALIGETGYRVQARLLALGELMATRLGAAYLKKEGMDVAWRDARNLLTSITPKNVSEKSRILSAVCGTDTDPELQEKIGSESRVILTQGFIASDREGKTVLLGRGGSDVSGAYFAAKLAAGRLEIWTDVPGLFSANPHAIPSARLLKKLSYEEAQEIATNGARVLHPRCITPVRIHDIPIKVKWTQQPDLEGTHISSAAVEDEALVKAIAYRNNVILISMESLGMWQEVGFLADAFAIFKANGLSIDLISTSESNVTVSLDPGVNTHFYEIRDDFLNELNSLCRVKIIEPAASISLLGRHIRAILPQLSSAFEVFREHEIYLVSQAANDLNFTFVVEADQADRLVQQLHEETISKSSGKDAFGQTWQQYLISEGEEEERFPAWWEKKREELIKIAERYGSAYVYDSDMIREIVKWTRNLSAVDRLFYAVKANENAEVLKIFQEAGLGFECVSIDEVEYVQGLFPDLAAGDILFTPNFAPRKEYEKALELGVNLTIDNLYILQKWPELFKGRELFLRIDPGHGHGHHEHVRTGGVQSKFGIPRFELEETKEILGSLDATVKGLHAHLGSGIKDPQSWRDTALILEEVAGMFEEVEVLDVGGGLGVRENEMQAALDLEEVNRSLEEFKDAYPQFELWMEPGRYLIATAGVLLSRITQLKGKGKVIYVGLQTGMNSLIRPALYGAHHTIVNLSKLDRPADRLVNIVGPICESGDKLGIDRMFPESEEGDVVLIANTGAYGHVMSSSYNMRQPAGEIVI